MILKIAWRNIWRNKRRSLITIGSIFFAVFLAVAMRALQTGVYAKMIENIVGSYSGYIQIHQKGYWDEKNLDHTFTESDSLLQKIVADKSIKSVAPRLEGFALGSYKKQTKGLFVIGINPEKEKDLINLGQKISLGKTITLHDSEIVIGKGVASYFNLQLHDTLVLLGQGMYGVTAAGKYSIKGIATFNSPSLNDQMVVMPLPLCQFFYAATNQLTQYSIMPKENEDVEGIYKRLQTHLDTTKYEVMDWNEMMPELKQTIQADSAGGLILLFILYLIITFGIFGTVLMMTAERSHEFGVLLAIGMKRRKMAAMMLLETILLSIPGVLIGIIAVLPFTYYFHFHPIYLEGKAGESLLKYGFEAVIPTSIDPMIPITHAAIIVVITLIISIYPIYKIMRLQPVEAMKNV